MASDRKVRGYIKAADRYAKLASRYEAKLDALMPLKRRVQAAEAVMLAKRQKMTGGELSRAQRLLSQAEHQVAQSA